MAKILIPIKTTGASKASSDLKKVDKSVDKLTNSVKKTSTSFGSLATKVGLAAVAFAGFRILKDFISNASEAAEATAALEAVLKSTEGVAGVTKESVLSLSNELQGLTAVSDDTITAGQALLLTFTSISKDVFPDAIRTALDMSRAFKTDLRSSVIQLGKALNDPIVGFTALQRVGVSFTQSQKDTIKTLQATGDILGAQRVILGELQKEVGGAAEAFSKTLPGSIERAKLALDDLSQAFGEALAPAIISGSEKTIEFLKSITNSVPAILFWIKLIAKIGGAFLVLNIAATLGKKGMIAIGAVAVNLGKAFKLASDTARVFGKSMVVFGEGRLVTKKLKDIVIAMKQIIEVTGATEGAIVENLARDTARLKELQLGQRFALQALLGAVALMVTGFAALAFITFKVGKSMNKGAVAVQNLREKFDEFSKIDSPEALEEINQGLSELELIAQTLPGGIAAITVEANKLVESLNKKIQDKSFLSLLKKEFFSLFLIGGRAELLTKDLNALVDAIGLATEARAKFEETKVTKTEEDASVKAATDAAKLAQETLNIELDIAESRNQGFIDSAAQLNIFAAAQEAVRIKRLEDEKKLTEGQLIAVNTLREGIDTIGSAWGSALIEGQNGWKALESAAKVAIANIVATIVANAAILALVAIINPAAVAGQIGGNLLKTLLGGVKLAAHGMNETVTRPTLILAGEAGPERVKITPKSQIRDRQVTPIIINIKGGLVNEAFVRNELNPIIASVQSTG